MTLKPCPFCAIEDVHLVRNDSQYAWQCQNCGARGPWRSSAREARSGWNCRPKKHNIPKEVW